MMLAVLRLTRRATYPAAGELVAQPSPHQNQTWDRTFTCLRVTGVAENCGASANPIRVLPLRVQTPVLWNCETDKR